MKKCLSCLGVLLFTSSVVFATGKDDPSAASNMAIIRNGAVVKVIYKADKTCVAKISITDNDGREIFQESVRSKKGFSRPYNIATLAPGDYTVKVWDENSSRSEKISVGFPEKRTVIYKIIQLKNDPSRYVLTIPVVSSGKITVTIYDEANKLLYTGYENVKADFARLYHLKDLKGKPSFEVLSD